MVVAVISIIFAALVAVIFIIFAAIIYVVCPFVQHFCKIKRRRGRNVSEESSANASTSDRFCGNRFSASINSSSATAATSIAPTTTSVSFTNHWLPDPTDNEEDSVRPLSQTIVTTMPYPEAVCFPTVPIYGANDPAFLPPQLSNMTSARTSENVCSICMEEVARTQALALPCAHVFHDVCIEAWRARSSEAKCPVCRAAIG